MVDIKEVQKFFFKGMLAGYAGDGKYLPVPGMPGYKQFNFVVGGFRLLDCYCVTLGSQKSVGDTTIWCEDVPVWVMQYGGEYDKDVIPFLKRTLHKTYSDGKFVGGRGYNGLREGNLVYINLLRLSSFSNFSGEEKIVDVSTSLTRGYHNYQGMSLLPG